MPPKKYKYIDEYLSRIRAKGGFSFTYSELLQAYDVSVPALNLVLRRLKSSKAIAQVRKGFYVILPPEYAHIGMIPASLFIDDLMKSMKKRYYVGLFSAAAIYGVSHQQPMEYFVITNAPAVRKIEANNIVVNFFVKKEWPDEAIIKKKTDAGYMNVSSSELTALDIMFYSDKISLNNAFTVLQELWPTLKKSALLKEARYYPQTAAIQRLGYLLEKIPGSAKLTESLFKVLSERNCYNMPLSPFSAKKGGINSRWKIIANKEIEGDL